MSSETLSVPADVSEQYRIRGLIGSREETGMVAVAGFDPRTEQEVFIKSRDSGVDENAAMRISREADVLASLAHPQIPVLIDADPDADRPYIVTELKDNNPRVLTDLKLNPNPTFAAKLCVAALVPLSYAHETGFTHRI